MKSAIQISHKNNWLLAFFLLATSAFLVSACAGSDPAAGATGADSTKIEYDLYQSGLAAYNTGDYSSAASLFQEQIDQYPDGSYADAAYLYQGRAYYGLQNYSAARDNFNKILAEFRDGSRIDSAQYWLGKAEHALGNYVAARAAYDAVDSAGQWIDNAAMQIGRTYYDEAGVIIDSASAYDLLASAYDLLDSAVLQLGSMLETYTTSSAITSSAIDDARYYLGRSHQEQAQLLQKYPTLAVREANEAYMAARAEYALLPPTSIFYDDALYFTGRSYQDQLPADYIKARVGFQSLVDMANSTWSDDALYQIGKTYYDEAVTMTDPALSYAGFTTAIPYFEQIITSAENNPASNRLDSSQYYNGRALHRQAALVLAGAGLSMSLTADEIFDMARIAYQALLDSDPNSSWADNALYQQGVTHQDQADAAFNQLRYVDSQTHLSAAIIRYKGLVGHAIYGISNSADNARYALGKSYQLANEIAAPDRIVITDGIDFTKTTLDDACDHFALLINNASYANSSWIDNARFEMGETYRMDAQNAVDPNIQKAAYNNALSFYVSVVIDYPLSIRVDNASYQIAIIYDKTGYCGEERYWFGYLSTLANASTTYKDQASIHLGDLTQAEPVQHVCGTPSLSNISIVTHPTL